MLSAFCDILGCTPADLVATTAETAGVRKTATDGRPAPSAAVAKLRPRIITRQAPLPEPERIAMPGRLLSGHDLPLRFRVAGHHAVLVDATADGSRDPERLGTPSAVRLLPAWMRLSAGTRSGSSVP
ncbi:hypothetical protein [Saccharothrix stipae]